MRRHIIVTAVSAAALLALGACSGSSNTSGGSSASGDAAYTVTSGKLTICADIPYPPFEIEDSSAPTGYSGFDIEIAGAIADKLGLELVVNDVDFDALQSGTVLVAGQCDMGTSAITITEERKANIDFADPYYDSLQSLLVKKDSGIKTLADLAGKAIGTQQGTTGLNYAEENAPADATIQQFPSDGELWPALQAGLVDAILQDLPVNVQHVKDDPSYEVVEQYQTDEQYGFAFAKGEHVQLREDVNTQLAALKADGTYQTIYDKYFAA
ncbi:MAG: ABC transporter substrate-binding protein [Propionibacteriaceae bacterium]|jgi:polar amino acid transport system substrate-binding protein|nr:ABC transporter substrate-binding protein [Propionibacteriaceae bacterium]